ncbi:MAG: [FeFe] hydrogenase H-cluster radical SAM maturase HydE [Bacteroidales bacterium]
MENKLDKHKFENLDKVSLVGWLREKDQDLIQMLHQKAYEVKVANIGNKVFLRGLIELSNKCVKNCLYCGIRCANTLVDRYELTDDQVLEAADFALYSRYGSLVLQAGERVDSAFRKRVTSLVKEIKRRTDNRLGITLSLGEQPEEVYREWFDAGAHRYLLRIESSNPDIYSKIHPNDSLHSFETRLNSLEALKRIGYQTGTGVMIGLPGQTEENLADDLLFFKSFGVHMVGMGPYLKHSDTPLGLTSAGTSSMEMPLKMISLLRLLMPKINIASTTALQVIDPFGREMGIMAGANIIMPNMTISEVRTNYQIYENKPGVKDDATVSKSKLEQNLASKGIEIGWDEWGDSRAFKESSKSI